MSLEADVSFVGDLLDEFAVHYWRRGGAAEVPGGPGVPAEMQEGEVDESGWVDWKILPSMLELRDVEGLESEFEVRFPPLFRAYLLARFHLFDQVHSRKYDQLVLMVDTPSDRPLLPIRELLTACRPLIAAGFVACGQWGDGWGPMCFDVHRHSEAGDLPIVWFDHELLAELRLEALTRREAVLPLAMPLYGSCREFLLDVFVTD